MEPATKQDLKDLLKEFREEFRRGIREAVAAGFGNLKPALEQATTPAASQLLSTHAPDSPTTIVDVVPVLAASSASAKSLDFDATGVAAPTLTTCSTECPSRDATASTFVFTLGTTPTSATATIDVTPLLAASVVTNDFTTPSRLLQAAAPALTHELMVLRPMPWPSFECSQVWTSLVNYGIPVSSQDVLQITPAMGDVQLRLSRLPPRRQYLLQIASVSRNAEVQSTMKHVTQSVHFLPHDTSVMKHFSSARNSLKEALRYLHSVQLKLPWPSFSNTCRAVQVHWNFLEHQVQEQAAVCSIPTPDHQLRMKSKLHKMLHPAPLQIFLIPSVEQHPWPPPHVISLMGVCGYELISMEEHLSCLQDAQLQSWSPPDRTKIRGVLVKFGRWQVFLVSSVKLQPWPSWQLTFLVSTEMSNCCDEMILPILKYSPKTTVLLCFSCHAIASTIVCSAGMQAITLASYTSFVVPKFKPLSQMQLLMVRPNCDAMSDSETWSLFSCSLFTGWPCELIIARTGSHSTSRNTKQLIGACLTSQQQKSTINLRSYSCWNWSFPLPIHAHIDDFSGLKWYLRITFNYVAVPRGYWSCEHLQPWRSIDRAHSLACMVDQSLYWHQAILTSRNLWPPRVKFRIYLIAIDTEHKVSQYEEVYLAAIDSTARHLEFKRSTLRCLGISLVENVLIGNELWLSSTQSGIGLRFLLPKPPWPLPIPTTSHLQFNIVDWMFYCINIFCSDCLLSKLQQSLMIQISVCLLVWFYSLGINKWLLWTLDTMSKDVNFLSLKSSSSGLLLMTSSTQCHFSVFAMRRNCDLELLPAFDVCIAACSELVLSVGIQLDLSELQPDDYTYLFYWHQSGYLFATDVGVMECGMGTSKLGVIWDPGGLFLVVPYPVSVSVQAPSPGKKHGMHVLKTATIKRTAIGIEHGGGNDIAIDLALVPWDPGRSTRHRKFSLDNNQSLFKEGGVSQLWPPLLSKSLLATSTSSDFDQVRAVSDYYLGDASFDLAQVYFDKGYYHDYTNTEERQVPWDPGGNTSASAWGQAEFQGGRIVSAKAKAAIGWGLGHRKRAWPNS